MFLIFCLFVTDPISAKIKRPEKNVQIPIGDGSPVSGTIGDNITALPNTSISITCPASGVPTPLVTWRKDGLPIRTGRSVLVNSQGTLTIHSSKIEDKGLYTCMVKNGDGDDSSSSQVNVVGKFNLRVVKMILRARLHLNRDESIPRWISSWDKKKLFIQGDSLREHKTI